MAKRVIPFLFVLGCCWTHVEGDTVLPPSNVTLHCHNMQNTLMWTYDQPSNGLEFKVTVSSIMREPVSFLVSSTSFDLSNYSDPDNEYMVMVSAVKGGDESEPVPEDGIEYSYFKDTIVPVKCKVDLPLVNVTTEDKHLHFSFTHPGLLYPTSHKVRKKKSHYARAHLPVFHYHIEVINQKVSHDYHCTESICQDKLLVHDSEKRHCLNISGEMKKMSVQATKQYCSEPLKRAGTSVLSIVLPLVLVSVLIIGIIAMVFFKKIRWETISPNVLKFPRSNRPLQIPPSSGDSEVLNSVHMAPSSPEAIIPPYQDTSVSSSGGDDLRLRLGVPDNENEPELEEAAQGYTEEGYTEGKYLDKEGEEGDEEEAPSPRTYELRTPLVNNYESNNMH